MRSGLYKAHQDLDKSRITSIFIQIEKHYLDLNQRLISLKEYNGSDMDNFLDIISHQLAIMQNLLGLVNQKCQGLDGIAGSIPALDHEEEAPPRVIH